MVYIVDYILKYETGNLIIIYCYIYSGLLSTIRDIIWKSMKLMRDVRSGPQVDG